MNNFIPRKTVWVFSGQGSQWPGMGMELAKKEAGFRSHYDRLLQKFQTHLDFDFKACLSSNQESALKDLPQMWPAILHLQMALADWFKEMQFPPQAVLGHSTGEIAAAYAAGILTADHAIRLMIHQSKVLDLLRGRGGMLLLNLTSQEAQEWIKPYSSEVQVAIESSPQTVVLSGVIAALDKLKHKADETKIFARFVATSVPVHSSLIGSLKNAFLDGLDFLEPMQGSSSIEFWSAQKGCALEPQYMTSQYWWDVLTRTVQFSKATTGLILSGYNFFIEMSPHAIVSVSIKETAAHYPQYPIQLQTTLKKKDWELSLSNCLNSLRNAGMIESPMIESPGIQQPLYFMAALKSKSLDIAKREVLLQAQIKKEVAQILGSTEIQGIAVNQGFKDLGLDSLMSMELRNRLQNIFGLNLSSTFVFDYPNIKSISAYILDQFDNKEELEPEGDKKDYLGTPIAVIGMACRFPGGANSSSAFWKNIESGIDIGSEIPSDRWDIEKFYDKDSDRPGKMYVRKGYFIDDIDKFDAAFFNISPNESKVLDPQQRLALEVAFEAFENAGYSMEKIPREACGVFMAASQNDYADLEFKTKNYEKIDAYGFTGYLFSGIPGRISYYFGLNGPSIAMDAACASSLTTVHEACVSIQTGECEMALAGGVHLNISPNTTLSLCRLKALAPDGLCKTFDKSADGYARGEGCGIVVLKSLAKALDDGDNILAVIKGTAVSHGGSGQGLTVPSGQNQQKLILKALRKAEMDPNDIDYIECHGTGTSLGDPIEVNAINEVFKRNRSTPLFVGSVKGNIGHTEAAAGVAGLIKTILMINHKTIVPQMHFKEPNPYLDLDQVPIKIPTTLKTWESTGLRRAGVSSFGVTGQNAHVILEEAPAIQRRHIQSDLASDIFNSNVNLLLLSAATRDALQKQCAQFSKFIKENESDIEGICYSRALHHSYLKYRIGVIGNNPQEIEKKLADLGSGIDLPIGKDLLPLESGHRVAFIFSGHGPQDFRMAAKLFETDPFFREKLTQIDEIFKKVADISVCESLTSPKNDHTQLDTDIAQPLIFAIQVGLFFLVKKLGINPHTVYGHSLGEAAAAYCGGALSLEDAAKVICFRSVLAAKTKGQGKMMSVDSDPASLNELIKAKNLVSFASINGPTTLVLSGPESDLIELSKIFEARGIRFKLLDIGFASHSYQMDTVSEELEERLKDIRVQPFSLPIYSSVSGSQANENDFNNKYWRANIRQTVQFKKGLDCLIDDGYNTFIEISSHPVIVEYVMQCAELKRVNVVATGTLNRKKDNVVSLYECIEKLYRAGLDFDFKKILKKGSTFPALPNYLWEKSRYWVDEDKGTGAFEASHPFIGNRIRQSQNLIQYENLFTDKNPYFFREHIIFGQIVSPGASHNAFVLTAARHAFGHRVLEIRDGFFESALALEEGDAVWMQLTFKEISNGQYEFQLASCTVENQHEWLSHAVGKLNLVDEVAPPKGEAPFLEKIKDYDFKIERNEIYENFKKYGYNYGRTFFWIEEAWISAGQSLSHLRKPKEINDLDIYPIAPTLLDALYQQAILTLPGGPLKYVNENTIYVPWSNKRILLYKDLNAIESFWCEVTCQNQEANIDQQVFTGNLNVYEEDGTLVLSIEEWTLKRIEKESLTTSLQRKYKSDVIYDLNWKEASFKITPKENAKILLLVNDDSLIKQFEEEFKRRNITALIAALPSKAFRKEGDIYYLRPSEKNDYIQLFKECGMVFDTIIYGWTHDHHELEWGFTLGAVGLMYLVQSLELIDKPPKLMILTSGLFVQNPAKPNYSIAGSLAWGFSKTIAAEKPELSCTRINLSNGPTGDAISRVVDIAQSGSNENEISISEKQCLVPRLKRAQLKLVKNLEIRTDSIYLITGGLGGLGFSLCEWLIKNGARNLVLCGRSKPQNDKLVLMNKLASDHQATIKFERCDVAVPQDVDQLFEGLDLPRLKGIFHLAGLLSDVPITQMSKENLLKVMGPKVNGTLLLHEKTKTLNLDYFVLFSSITSLLGSPGQANYSAANAFMDEFAYYRKSLGLPAQTIHWGPWGEVGLAAKVSKTIVNSGLSAVGMISPHVGFEALSKVMRSGIVQSTVLCFDWDRFDEEFPVMAKFPITQDIKRRAAPQGDKLGQTVNIVEIIQKVEPSKRPSYLEDFLIKEIAQVLGHSDSQKIESNRGFFQLGGDSLSSVQLRNRLQSAFNQYLPTSLIFNYPTVVKLRDYLLNKFFAADSVPVAQEKNAEEIHKKELSMAYDQLSIEELEEKLMRDLEN